MKYLHAPLNVKGGRIVLAPSQHEVEPPESAVIAPFLPLPVFDRVNKGGRYVGSFLLWHPDLNRNLMLVLDLACRRDLDLKSPHLLRLIRCDG